MHDQVRSPISNHFLHNYIFALIHVGSAHPILIFFFLILAGEKRKDENEDDLIVSSQTYINLTASYLKAETQNSRPPVPEKNNSRRRSISCKRLVNRHCSTPLRELSPAYANAKALVPYVSKKVCISILIYILKHYDN